MSEQDGVLTPATLQQFLHTLKTDSPAPPNLIPPELTTPEWRAEVERMSEHLCYRNQCPNVAVARITLTGGTVKDTMTFEACLSHYYEAVRAFVGVPITAGAIKRAETQYVNPRGKR